MVRLAEGRVLFFDTFSVRQVLWTLFYKECGIRSAVATELMPAIADHTRPLGLIQKTGCYPYELFCYPFGGFFIGQELFSIRT